MEEKLTIPDKEKYAFAALIHTYHAVGRKQLGVIFMNGSSETTATNNSWEIFPAGSVQRNYETWASSFMNTIFVRLSMNNEEQRMILNLPDVDLIDVPMLKDPLVNDLKAWAEQLVFELLVVALSDGKYTAYDRALIQTLAVDLGLGVDSLVGSEGALAAELFQSPKTPVDVPVGLDQTMEHVIERDDKGRVRRYVQIGLAAVGGGAVIGLTGGLAAPLVGAGLASIFGAIGIGGTTAFLSGAGGVALITSLFGATGAGISSMKIAYRNRGIGQFSLISHDRLRLLVDIEKDATEQSVWKSMLGFKKLDNTSAPESPTPSPTGENMKEDSRPLADIEKDSTEQSVWKSMMGFKKSANVPELESVIAEMKKEDSPPSSSNNARDVDARNLFETELDQTRPYQGKNHLSVTIAVSGWITSVVQVVEPWEVLKQNGCPYFCNELVSLCWETKELLRLASAVEEIVTTEAVSFAATQALSQTLVAGLMTAMIWPASLLKIASLIDNPWAVALERARKSGLILADVLLSLKQGNRPVTLVGSSLGARVIFYCLLELSSKPNAETIVSDVILIGAPITPTLKDLRQIRTIVSGRIVNAYCSTDWVLGFLMRAGGGFTGIAGLCTLESGLQECNCSIFDGSAVYSEKNLGIQNIDISDIVSGHVGYRDPEKMAKVFDKITTI